MSATISWGTGSTGTPVSVSLVPWAYSDAFRSKTSSTTLARLTNTVVDIDKPVEVKLTCQKIANVYDTLANGTIPVDNQAPNTSGQTVFAELSAIATYTDSESNVIYLPIVSRVELRLPNSSELTAALVRSVVLATYATLCDDAGADIVISEKMRGALAPAGI